MRLLWEDRAWEDYLYWQTQDRKTLKRINAMIGEIKRAPFEGVGNQSRSKGILADIGVGVLMISIELSTLSKMKLSTLFHAEGITTIDIFF